MKTIILCTLLLCSFPAFAEDCHTVYFGVFKNVTYCPVLVQ